jgi:transposase-like protein
MDHGRNTMILKDISQLTEERAREYLEGIRWPNGPVCPHCGSVEGITRFQGEVHRDGVYKCNPCGQQFTVTVNSIFHGSHISIRTWLMALSIMCSSKKGVSALQLQRQLGLGSYRSAWHLAHRIRHAMAREPLASLLKGVVEVDEAYIGGKPRKLSGEKAKRGRGTKKTPVVALIERDGRVRARKLEWISSNTLKEAIRDNVDRSATIMTDEMPSYRGIGKEFAGGHKTVKHRKLEFARADGAGINTAESFFALLKRGVVGSFHHISKTHLDRYCDEFSFRWDHRKSSDSERTIQAIRQSEGRRLTYAPPSGTQTRRIVTVD